MQTSIFFPSFCSIARLSPQKYKHIFTKRYVALLSISFHSSCIHCDSWGVAIFLFPLWYSLLFIQIHENTHCSAAPKETHRLGLLFFASTVTCLPTTITQNIPRFVPYLPSTCKGDNITMTTEQGGTRQARKIAVDTRDFPLRGSRLTQIICASLWSSLGIWIKRTCKHLALTRHAASLE